MEQSIKQQQWKQQEFQKNKETHRVKQQQRRKEIKEFVESLKGPCVICGEDDKACIDFHHKDPTEKDFEMGNAGKHKWSNKKIIDEVNKCVSICSNHHRKLHYYNFTIEEMIEKYK